ncbi:odontogenesis associated phosphoprotein [Nycticebus coucang]|uniref:odontogenesis associated phosphoprotein n=1 Tax=Nycticebus coucang TaxID=9470 RepID=UPI00234D6969|nr:odontogenesis associated phosphoprotein [Nycticebus coucang]XP_053441336.1 odontogenesis associated phosphoprotein [Nycticebus coucang]
MAHRHHFSCLALVCWLLVTVAEGQEVLTPAPPGGPQHNVDPTDCQIFTLTPPPITRNPVTSVQPLTRTPKFLFHFFPQGPRVYLRFPNRPFFLPKCNHRFQFRPFFWPTRPRLPHRFFYRRKLQRGSSSEES